jgi:hypothetical protein
MKKLMLASLLVSAGASAALVNPTPKKAAFEVPGKK